MIKISLERIAAKLHWYRTLGDPDAEKLLSTPRYVEALCFLQAASHLPGGVEKFVEGFLAAYPEWVSSLSRLGQERLSSFAAHLQLWYEAQMSGMEIRHNEFNRLFPGFLETLCRYMDLHAEAEMDKTADTSLRRKVLFELDFARVSSPPVPMVLIADTRHGKTTAVDTFCRAWPGRARLVTVPESNHEREFYEAYAEAFGMEFTPKTQTRTLKNRVQFTLRSTGIMCVHDEAHWLVPIRYQQDTPPQRINWVRTQIIDRHLPCAFFCTPQSQEDSLARYLERTHHNMEQWLGRMPKPVLVSDKPTYEDLVSVAKVRFPEFPPAALEELCDAADEKIDGAGARINGEGGFKIIELAGARARYMAAQRSGKVSIAEIRQAVAWAGAPLPDVAARRHAQPEEFSGTARGGPGRRGAAAESPQRLRSGDISERVTAPTITV
jgi:hypothetical protein